MHFQFRNFFYQQIKVLPMGALLSRLLANIYAEHIKIWASNSYFLTHIFWERYINEISSLWNYGEHKLRVYLDCLNTYDKTLQFTLEIEFSIKISFLDVLIIRS